MTRTYRVGRIGDPCVVTVKAPSLIAALDLAAERCGWQDLDGVTADVRAGGRWMPAVEAEERSVRARLRARALKITRARRSR